MVHWLPALERVADTNGWHLLALTKTGCAFMSIDEDEVDTVERKSCAAWNQSVQAQLKQLSPELILVAASSGAVHMLPRSERQADQVADRMSKAWAEAYSATSAEIVAFRETPRMRKDPSECMRQQKANPGACARALNLSLPTPSLIEMAKGYFGAGASVIDMSDIICRDGQCSPVAGGLYVWRDAHHLTASFARSMAPVLNQRIQLAVREEEQTKTDH